MDPLTASNVPLLVAEAKLLVTLKILGIER